MNNQTQDLVEKKKAAINRIRCFTYFTEFCMYIYGGFFLYGFINSVKTRSIFVSFVLNFGVVLACASACEDCRKYMRKSPANFKRSQTYLKAAICYLLTFAVLYNIAAVAVSSLLKGQNLWLSIFLFVFALPQLVLGIVGLVVVKNFNILLAPIPARPAFLPQPQVPTASINNGFGYNNNSTSYNNGAGYSSNGAGYNNGGYAKAPGPYDQPQNQAMAKNGGYYGA